MSTAVPDLLLRRVRPAEWDAVGEITVAAYAAFTQGPEDPYLDRLRDVGRRDREAEVVVAFDAATGTPLGSVTLCPPTSTWREIGRPEEGEFRMLAVSPTAQGRGVGAALVRYVLERSAEDGMRRVVLSSLPQMTAAHRLYASLGFTRTPERDHTPVPGVDLWAFARELTAG